MKKNIRYKINGVKISRCIWILISIYLIPNTSFSQRGKNGSPPAISTTTVVNEYTTLSADAATGATIITVASSALNTNNRFPGTLAPGDLIMIIQIQGATILGTPPTMYDPFSAPKDSSWGEITNYNTCGNWEFGEVTSVPNGTSITLDCPIINNYTSAGRVVVVRVPRYSSLTINNGGSINCDPWNGSIGGVCAIEVQNNTTINTGGSIDVTGNGFRGGAIQNENPNNVFGIQEAATATQDWGAQKGEGIAGYQTDYSQYGGMYCKSSPANGGGGGNSHNGGGGGGANGGNPLSWNGHGIPDNTGAGWATAWNLQYVGFSAQTSTGGGQGGYTFSSSNQNATTTGPNKTAWGGDNRSSQGGFGGRPLDYSTGKLFLGGAGGAGEEDDNFGGAGGNGGGLIYLMNYGSVSGAGQIISNGNVGVNATGTATGNNHAGQDGAGGGGAGGTIIVNSVGNIAGVSITANGANGGDQVIVRGPLAPAVNEAEGPGGGGGGGYIAISNGAPVRTANGGANGTTNSSGLTEFIPNGATKGDSGTTHGAVTNFIINAPNVTICAGQSATLTGTLTGTVPAGTTIIWYDNIVAGNIIGTGATYTTTVLANGTYTYYVGTCPGTYHQPVVVTVSSSPLVSAGPDVTICTSGSTTLNASGGTIYSWSPTTNLSNPNISNPVANPASTTTYVVTVTTPCGNGKDTVVVTVNSSIAASISGNTTICSGSPTTLTASGGGIYSWNTGVTTTTITVSPSSTTNYSVTVSNGNCSSTASVTVTVSNGINATINGPNAVCTGNSATLTASGGGNYSWWNSGGTTSSITVTPTANTTYTVTVSNGSCSGTATATVNVSSTLTATISGNTTICGGGSTTLTASGGTSFSWSTGATTATLTASSPGNYSVTVSSGNCSSIATVTVNTSPAMTINSSNTTTPCGQNSGTATASVGGGTGAYTYSWNPGAQTTQTATGLGGGNYTVTVSDALGCAITSSTTVVSIGTPIANISGNTLLCTGDATTLTASGGTNYSWSNGSTATALIITPSSTVSYTLTAFNGMCTDTAVIKVIVSPPPTAAIASNTTICVGQAATLTASGGGNYSWNTGATTSSIIISPTINSPYSVTVSIGSCSNTANASVNVVAVPTPSITAASTLICGGDVTTLTASGAGGNTYSWSNGMTSASIAVTPSATTTYTVTSSNGVCTDTASVKITVLPPPHAAISGNLNICQGNAATLTASGGGIYSWSSGQTTAAINPVTTGSYTVVVSIGTCTDTAVKNLTVNPNPTATVSPTVIIIQGQSTVLSASGGTSYSWDNGMNGSDITVSPAATTIYCVTVYDGNNCYDSACVTVTVDYCSGAGMLYLPNAFSPNGDRENDFLQIYYGIPQCIKTFHLVIYNRWGEKIYETNDPAFKWDGIYNQGMQKGTQTANTEVFTYYMDVEILDGSKIDRKGNISLVR